MCIRDRYTPLSEEETEQILSLCDEVIDSSGISNGVFGYNTVLGSAIITMAYTRRWIDGYELWCKINDAAKSRYKYVHDKSSTEAESIFDRLHKCTKPLALAALKNDRVDIFWIILNDPSFHLNNIYLREGLDTRVEANLDVFAEYIKHCAKYKSQHDSEVAYDNIVLLFEYFRKHFIAVNYCLFRVLNQELFSTDLPIFIGKKQISCVKVCLLYTSPSPRDATLSRMQSSA